MAMNKPKPGETALSSVSQEESKTAEPVLDSDTGDKPHSEPRLSSYYSDSRIKAAAFVKAVNATKLTRFDGRDVYETRTRLDELDPTLSRTVGLLGKGPDPVDRWVAEVTKETLRQFLSCDASDEYDTACSIASCG